MNSERTYRINGFDQIKAFYSWVFNNQDKEIGTSHIALYNFLVNQNNRSNWVEWFKVPYDLGMAGSCIGSRNTYYKCLKDLQAWGLIEYKPGINNYKAPVIKLRLLKSEQVTEQVTIPLSEPLTEQVTIPLSEPLTEHIYKLLTNNLKRITNNIEEVLKYLDSLDKPKFNFKKSLIELGVEENIASDWIKVRMAKKGANTETAFNKIKKEIQLSGAYANDCIRKAVEKSWCGFEAEWFKNSKYNENGTTGQNNQGSLKHVNALWDRKD